MRKYRYGALFPEFSHHDGLDFRCTVRDDERKIFYSGSRVGHVRVHDHRGAVIKSSDRWDATIFSGRNDHDICSMALTKDGEYLFTGSRHGDVGIWRTDELRCLGMIQIGDGTGEINDMHIAEDEQRLFIHQGKLGRNETVSLRIIPYE